MLWEISNQYKMRLRNFYELSLMEKSGRIAAAALKKTMDSIEVGVSGLDLDKIAQDQIYKLGGDLSYKTVPGYNFATCVTVNEAVVHGIPTDRKFERGDIVSVDLAVEYRGWHTDCAWTVLVGESLSRAKSREGKGKGEREKEKFLKVGEEALWAGIAQAIDGNRVGDISEAIQVSVEQAGYSVVRSLVGHGIGRRLHEEPEIPGYGKKGTGDYLKSGMALAIEVIYTMGGFEVVLGQDGWTYCTKDKSLAGLFEMTVIVGKKEAKILTDFRS